MTTTREGVSALDPWTRWALPHTPENLVESAELLGLILRDYMAIKHAITREHHVKHRADLKHITKTNGRQRANITTVCENRGT